MERGQVHFKLRSARSYSAISFDGHFIRLSELKKQIARSLHLLKPQSSDFELKVHSATEGDPGQGDLAAPATCC